MFNVYWNTEVIRFLVKMLGSSFLVLRGRDKMQGYLGHTTKNHLVLPYQQNVKRNFMHFLFNTPLGALCPFHFHCFLLVPQVDCYRSSFIFLLQSYQYWRHHKNLMHCYWQSFVWTDVTFYNCNIMKYSQLVPKALNSMPMWHYHDFCSLLSANMNPHNLGNLL